jgi:histidine triad (HIT) family protein
MKKEIDDTFLKIIEGVLPSYKIYEDEYTYAFLSNQPVTRGHALVIPKVFAENMYDVSEESLAQIFSAVKKVSLAIKNSLNPIGINIHQNNELGAGQAVFHIHFHIIPRYENDNIVQWHTSYRSDNTDYGIVAKLLSDKLS